MLRNNVSRVNDSRDNVSMVRVKDPKDTIDSKRGMKMFTRFGSLDLKINIKKPIASLLVCYLLFGSLTFSSCSPKNNSAGSMTNRRVINPDSDATSAPVAKKTVAEKEATVATEVAELEDKKEDTKEKKDPKDGHIPVDTLKGASWVSVGVSGGSKYGFSWFIRD